MAHAAKLGGAKGLRIEGVKNISNIKNEIKLPVIGLIKKKLNNKERYICPTKTEIEKVIKTNCEYIAVDYTLRDGMNKNYYKETTMSINEKSDCKIVADISNIEEAKIAIDCGVDFISTALRGYTKKTENAILPDIEFIKQLRHEGIDNLIAEGGYSTHVHYTQALNEGANIVIIGTAITRPHLIVKNIITGKY